MLLNGYRFRINMIEMQTEGKSNFILCCETTQEIHIYRTV